MDAEDGTGDGSSGGSSSGCSNEALRCWMDGSDISEDVRPSDKCVRVASGSRLYLLDRRVVSGVLDGDSCRELDADG